MERYRSIPPHVCTLCHKTESISYCGSSSDPRKPQADACLGWSSERTWGRPCPPTRNLKSRPAHSSTPYDSFTWSPGLSVHQKVPVSNANFLNMGTCRLTVTLGSKRLTADVSKTKFWFPQIITLRKGEEGNEASLPYFTMLSSAWVTSHVLPPLQAPKRPSQSYPEVIYGAALHRRLKFLTNKASGWLGALASHVTSVPRTPHMIDNWLQIELPINGNHMPGQEMGKQEQLLL